MGDEVEIKKPEPFRSVVDWPDGTERYGNGPFFDDDSEPSSMIIRNKDGFVVWSSHGKSISSRL